MIVEQRDYHVTTGKLNELVKLYETEGIELQQSYLGNLLGAYTTDIGALSTYTSCGATRTLPSASAPREAAGRRRAGRRSSRRSSR